MANEPVKVADSGATKRALIIGLGSTVVVLSLLFYTSAKVWLCENAWFKSAFIDGPGVVLAIIAWRELSESREANQHRRQMSEDLSGTKLKLATMAEQAQKANEYRNEANDLRRENNELERKNFGLNEKLADIQQQIAHHLKRPPTKAERNAATLRKYMRKLASVSQEGTQPVGYEIVEISDDNIVTLFLARGAHSTRSITNRADCGEMTIEEAPEGGCSLRIHISKFIGRPRDWGQIPRWEDRDGATAPSIEKASGAACNAAYGKAGSGETRTLNIFQSKDGANSFQLESNEGWAIVGDNVQVSKDFMATQIEYFAANFTRSTYGTGATLGGYRLYIC